MLAACPALGSFIARAETGNFVVYAAHPNEVNDITVTLASGSTAFADDGYLPRNDDAPIAITDADDALVGGCSVSAVGNTATCPARSEDVIVLIPEG